MDTKQTGNEYIDSIQELELITEKERISRMQIEASAEHKAIKEQIQELENKRREMFDTLEDSSAELIRAKLDFVQFLDNNQSFEDKRIKRKYRTKKSVNPTKVLEALGGDFGMFQELIKISQKDLKEFYPENTELHEQFKDCIVLDSRELTGFEIVTPK